MKTLAEWQESINEGLRGENFYYEWDLMNKTNNDAIKALKAQGFKELGNGTWRNDRTKELADIKPTTKGFKIDISDSHGKRLA